MNNKFNGKVTKLPDALNPNMMIMEAMDKKYSACPFCRESRRVDCIHYHDKGIRKYTYRTWYGKRKESFFDVLRFWEKDFHWRIDYWKCHTCGAEWESEPYPTDVVDLADNKNDIFINRISELGIIDGRLTK